MSTWIEPPPPQKGMGCFAKGCLILLIFFALLGAAFVGGTMLAMRYLRTQYFPTNGIELPATNPSDQDLQAAMAKWADFEAHVQAHQPARLEMTANELNALIASESFLRGKAHVSIEGDSARVKVSIPLTSVGWLKGHYMNGECTVQAGTTGSPGDVRFSSIVVNDRPVPDEAFQWQYGPWSVRRYINDWAADQNLKTFDLRDGKMILETKGD